MNTYRPALLLLLLWTGVVLGQTRTDFDAPKQTILGAEKPIALGRLVRLRVSPLEKTPAHLLSSAYTWKIFDGASELDDVMDLNGSVFFGAGIENRRLTAHCIATHLFAVRGSDNRITEIATRTVWMTVVVVIGQGPQPPPGPGPGPEPEPTFPDGQYQLAQKAYTWANSKVSDPLARTKGAEALARSFRGLASAIAAGADKELVKALEKAKAANNRALQEAGIRIVDWDGFGNDLMDYTYRLYTDKKLNTVQDLGVAWNEIAAGLEKVKR